MSTEDTIEIEYTPKPYGHKSCFHIPKSIMGSEAVPLFLPIQSYIYNDVNGGTVIVTDVSSNSYSSFEVVIQYVHKDLGKRICISKITDAQTINSEEGFNHFLKELLRLAQKIHVRRKEMNGFKCDKCGLCCRKVGRFELMKDFDRGDGVCKHLTDDNLCAIYDHRPTICDVDRLYGIYFKDKMSKEEWYRLQTDACEKLKEERLDHENDCGRHAEVGDGSDERGKTGLHADERADEATAAGPEHLRKGPQGGRIQVQQGRMGLNYDEWTVGYRDKRGFIEEWRCYAVSEKDAVAQFRNCNPSKITEGAEVTGAHKSEVAHGRAAD